MIEKSVSPTFTDAVSTALETGDTSQLKAFSEALDERVLRMKAAVPVQSPRDTSAPQTKVPSVPIRERESVRRKPATTVFICAADSGGSPTPITVKRFVSPADRTRKPTRANY
jgi:hypothetical protein